jgi:hypothetical protein
MRELYSILGVSEDDIDVDIRYCITYVLREGILDLSEAWVHRPIIERFRGYTHQNVFHLQLVNPDVAIQEIVDEIYDALCELLPWPRTLEVENLWYEVRIFTVGDPEAVEKALAAYLEAVRRSRSKDEN